MTAGWHAYLCGRKFSYANFDADPCAGGIPTDGEGIIFDTWDGSQGGLPVTTSKGSPITIFLWRTADAGFKSSTINAGSSHALIYVYNNTSWGNELDTHQNSGGSCGEIRIVTAVNVQVYQNIAQTTAATGCGGFPFTPIIVAAGNSTDTAYSNVGYACDGKLGGIQSSGSFAYGYKQSFWHEPKFRKPFYTRSTKLRLGNQRSKLHGNGDSKFHAHYSGGESVRISSPEHDAEFRSVISAMAMQYKSSGWPRHNGVRFFIVVASAPNQYQRDSASDLRKSLAISELFKLSRFGARSVRSSPRQLKAKHHHEYEIVNQVSDP